MLLKMEKRKIIRLAIGKTLGISIIFKKERIHKAIINDIKSMLKGMRENRVVVERRRKEENTSKDKFFLFC